MWVLILGVVIVGFVLTFVASPRLRRRSNEAMKAEFAVRDDINRWRELGPARRRTERWWVASRVALIGGTVLWSGCIGVAFALALRGMI